MLLVEQNRALWDRLLIGRGLASLARAEALAQPRGLYLLQAAIAACHALRRQRRRDRLEKDHGAVRRAGAAWHRRPSSSSIARLLSPWRTGQKRDWHWLTSWPRRARSGVTICCRACARDLLVRLGRLEEARAEFQHAATLTQNDRERRLLLDRASACVGGS